MAPADGVRYVLIGLLFPQCDSESPFHMASVPHHRSTPPPAIQSYCVPILTCKTETSRANHLPDVRRKPSNDLGCITPNKLQIDFKKACAYSSNGRFTCVGSGRCPTPRDITSGCVRLALARDSIGGNTLAGLNLQLVPLLL